MVAFPALLNFETVPMPYLEDAYRAARALLPDPGEAEAAVRETYVDASRTGSERSRRRVFHLLLRRIRAQGKQRFFGTNDQANHSGLQDDVLVALRGLPAERAEVLLLADALEFDLREIEDILGIEASEVSQLLVLGRKDLADKLNRSWEC